MTEKNMYKIVLYDGEYLVGEVVDVYKDIGYINLFDEKNNKHYMIPFRDIWYFYEVD
ncbi:MAG: hypothetical protein ACP5M8_08265 [Caldisphaera sp.]